MPTNLPPEYFEAEKRFKETSDPKEKVERLEELISTIPKHKGTDKLRGDLRRKLSKLKDAAAKSRRAGSRADPAYQIEREGAGQAILIGPSNVGKSALLVALSNAEPEVSEAPFTTWTPTPGMMTYENVQFQLIDTPSLDRDYLEPALMALIRQSDVLLPVVDIHADPVSQLEETLALLQEHRILPERFRGKYPEDRRLAFAPIHVVANKCDDERADENVEIFRRLLDEDWPLLAVSAATGRNLEQLGASLFRTLQIIRVYSKPPGKEPNREAPFVMKSGGTVEQFAAKIHHDFYERLKSARVWGHGVHDGQMVSRDHVLHDGDVVELKI